tara:strand:+ start:208 stop:3108 length:2901 start_codon:yes stop_codon:yes gene_type:complete
MELILLVIAAPTAHVFGNAPSRATSCSTWYDTTTHGSAFRSAADFGATGDGVTDDSLALQLAIDFDRGDVNQKRPAVVYLPPGEYVVSSTLVMYFYTHLYGSISPQPGCRSTLVLAANASGFGNASSATPMVTTNNGFNMTTARAHDWRNDTVNKNMLFYAEIHHVDFDLGRAAAAQGAVAILWTVAQQTSLRDIRINASGALAGLDVGYSDELGYDMHGGQDGCGGGGTVEDIRIHGGRYGMRTSATQWFFKSIHIESATEAGILLADEAWGLTMLAIEVVDVPLGVLALHPFDNVIFISSRFDLNPKATCAFALAAGGGGLLLTNVTARGGSNLKWVVNNSLTTTTGAGATSSTTVSSWKSSGETWRHGVKNASMGASELYPSYPLTATSPIPVRARPTFTSTPPYNVRDGAAGAKGDGVADDTVALQAAINGHDVLFLPYGTYHVTDTLVLRSMTKIVGEGMARIVLTKHASGFDDVTKPKALIMTPSDPNGEVTLCDLVLTSERGNEGAILLEWRVGVNSGTFDVHLQLFVPVHTALYVAPPFGAGVFTNMWGWGGDHNLTDNTDMSPHLSARTGWLGALVGARIESPGPTVMLGTAFEHHVEWMYFITNASDVTLIASQTENPYWNTSTKNVGVRGTPACDAKSLAVKNSSRVRLFGAVWTSWFCTLRNGLAQIDAASTDVDVFATWSVGGNGQTPAVSIRVGVGNGSDGAYNVSNGKVMALVVSHSPPGDPCGRYTNVSNAWRSVLNEADCPANPGPNCTWSIPTPTKGARARYGMTDAHSATTSPILPCDSGDWQATGLGGEGWYRFLGAGGDALPTSPPGEFHCGTQAAGWLSDWPYGNLRCDGDGTVCGPAEAGGRCGGTLGTPGRCSPPQSYNASGAYPAAAGAHARAPANATVCFDYSDPDDPDTGTCLTSAVVGVARCEAGFLLWRLPYAPDCSAGYGTVLINGESGSQVGILA